MAYREEESGLNVVAVENGVNASPAGVVKLGGPLTEPTTIDTTAANTLTVAGLQPGAATDKFVTIDATGVVRQTTAAGMITNALTFASGAFTSNVAGVAATLTPTAGTPVTQLGVNAAGALVTSPVADFWSSNGTYGTFTAPDGTTDLTENVWRQGQVGVNTLPLSTLDSGGSVGTGVWVSSDPAPVLDATHATLMLVAPSAQAVTLPAANTAVRRIYTITNPTIVDKTISAFTDLSGNISATTIPARSVLVVQSVGPRWRQIAATGAYTPPTDFWSSNAALGTFTAPDGTTDLTDAIWHGSDTGAGRVGVNTVPVFPLHVANATGSATALFERFTNDNQPAFVFLRKSRGTTVGANVALPAGDFVGSVGFHAAHGAGYNYVSTIQAVTAENHSATAAGTWIQFATTRLGTVGMVEAMRITPSRETGQEATQMPYLAMNPVGQNRRVVLWDGVQADPVDFYGFGINTATLRYQTTGSGNHRFYSGTSPIVAQFNNGSTEFYGNVGAGPALNSGGVGVHHFFGGHTGTAVTQAKHGQSFVEIDPGARNGTFVYVSRAAVPGFLVSHNGTVFTVGGSVAYSVVSDGRLKTGIRRLSSALERTLRLSGVEFDWTGDSPNTGHDVGFIAQDVQAVMPEAVTPITEDGTLSVQHTKIVPLLVEAVRELAAEVRRLGGNLPDITPTY